MSTQTQVRRKDNKNRVLREGEYQRENLSYEYKWQGVDGHRHSVYAPTLDELREKEKEVQKKILTGIAAHDKKTTVNQMFERFRQLKKVAVRENTFCNYIYMYEMYCAETIGKRRVTEVKKSDIRAFYAYLHEERGLKPATVDSVHTVLIQVFELACDDCLIATNPCNKALTELRKATAGKDNPRERALSVAQQNLLEDYLRNDPAGYNWYPILEVLLWSGLRVGECTGLRWCDIDLESDGIIDVNHTLVYFSKGKGLECRYAINDTKTPASKRKLPMLPQVKEAFLMEKQRHIELGLECKSNIDGYTDFIFLNRFGEVMSGATINKAIRRIIRDCNLKVLEKHSAKTDPVLLPNFSCHSLRHTFTTRLVEGQINIKVLQSLLGHSDAETTIQVYASCFSEFEAQEVERMHKVCEELMEKGRTTGSVDCLFAT
mgnify:CR=1 FL=1